MSNHVHLLVTPAEEDGASHLMHLVGLHYSKAVNRKLRRTGTLWEERLHASEVRSDAYVLTCYRYIELNPVRAGMAARPDDYRWSSYASNARIEPTAWLCPHPTMVALGNDPESMASRYRALFSQALDDVIVANLRTIGEPLGTTNVPRSGG
jgi:putative transposase